MNLCLTEEEVKEIASKGQLTTTKMFHLPDELKRISAGVIDTEKQDKSDKNNENRGRAVEESSHNLDRAAKRALKKRKYRERKKEEKRKAM